MSAEKAPGSTKEVIMEITLAALKVVGYGLAAIGPGIGIGVERTACACPLHASLR